ncbi:ATP-binding cassette domain-containing protein [Methanosphaera cuniculi]|uniref:Daunorubicin/doxorubicin resistance ATP-binding protein DrrA n=1 Tax=Methanosphaera cuniculi TaxID=1077256 RepID=A0A2V2BTW2_9EURY|nr:ATP-binding cassette domain-containing protein [Methanosphaera cuniculi]PWL08091.1 daunorubicin/doxorubicin resistance ATP-binding protein DrrA [Methanosphaera cuniculi]
MDDYILQTENLTKKYDNKTIINNLNLKIKKGEIYALLGKNGAGKTTTMCMMTKLIKKDKGEIKIFNKNIENNNEIFKKIGTLIEYPGFYENLTGLENLKYFQEIQTKPDKSQLEKILKIVGLHESKDKLVKKYSMGMKQRLAIATAIINTPDLLILDEPINGLDPKGIIDMRMFLKSLSKEYGMTILISSHILSEIEQIADRIGIINHGEIIEEIKIEDIKEKLYKYTEIQVDQIEKAQEILTENQKIEIKNNTIYVEEKKEVPTIIQNLTLHGINIYSAIPIIENLEEYFINKTNDIEQTTPMEDEYICLT